ncbi:MAG: cysteine--tRNA ligase, partial [Eubacterium sp.]|nr:cysteine--tRNA ligase [Eubacterium sp.]
MKLYNTLTKQKEEFVPVHEGKVGMYVCGPTVYNFIHIGNARPMIVFDTVRRYFEYKGYEVNYVSNFTDVDDKIIKKANEEGVSASEISERYIKECKKDMEGLNIKPATHNPKATEEIDGMIRMISTLIEKGYAYEKSGTVYFRTRKFENYGQLSKKNLDDMQAGIRIAVSDEKEDSMDFVLWKPKKEGEPSWSSPWGDGRPGWHIECSEMSKKYIGDTIDIHAGGEDLIFPHHENEIAQSEACNGEPFAKYWMHNAFLNIDNKKMSKSAGNFFTVREISEKYPLQVIRFFMLSAHYRSPLNFSDTLVEASKNGLERILTAVDRLREILKTAPEREFTPEDEKNAKEVDALKAKFEEAMDDDFNTADAIAAIFELVKLANITAQEGSRGYVRKIYDTIVMLCDILGIITDKKEELLDQDIEALIEERQAARKAK